MYCLITRFVFEWYLPCETLPPIVTMTGQIDRLFRKPNLQPIHRRGKSLLALLPSLPSQLPLLSTLPRLRRPRSQYWLWFFFACRSLSCFQTHIPAANQWDSAPWTYSWQGPVRHPIDRRRAGETRCPCCSSPNPEPLPADGAVLPPIRNPSGSR